MKRNMSLSLVLLLALFVYGCASFSKGIGQRRKNLAKIELGMSEPQVLDIMGYAHSTEVFMLESGEIIKILRYRTEHTFDGPVLKSDLTPICLQEDRVIGWGRKFYNNMRSTTKFIYP